MTALNAHNEVNSLFADASNMQFLNAARTSFDNGSVSVAPTSFSQRGGGAGLVQSGGTTATSKANESASAFASNMQKEATAYMSFLDDITGRSDKLRKEQEQQWLQYAKSIGDITNAEFEVAMSKLSETQSEMNQFAIQAARNIQSILGDGLYQMLSGRFDDMGQAFVDMINKMMADLISSQLASVLFGNFGSSGQIGGIIGQIAGAIGGAIGGSMSGGLGGATTIGAGSTAGGAGAVAFPVYAEGGYTGMGGKYEPAGVVHRGEYVMNANATNKLGVGFLDRLNKGYANGGYVGASSGANMGGVNINIKNEAGADGYKATAQVNKNEGGLSVDVIVRKVIATDLRNNGQIAQQMGSTFGLRRSM